MLNIKRCRHHVLWSPIPLLWQNRAPHTEVKTPQLLGPIAAPHKHIAVQMLTADRSHTISDSVASSESLATY